MRVFGSNLLCFIHCCFLLLFCRLCSALFHPSCCAMPRPLYTLLLSEAFPVAPFGGPPWSFKCWIVFAIGRRSCFVFGL